MKYILSLCVIIVAFSTVCTGSVQAWAQVVTFVPGNKLMADQLNQMQKGLVLKEDGSSTGQTLINPRIPTSPSDVPGTTGAAVPNTSWVDRFFTPLGTFILVDTTWAVCASGCRYNDISTAWNDARHANFLWGATLTISVADGTYSVASELATNSPSTGRVSIIGDTADPSKVILNFTGIHGTNQNGFHAYAGGVIGLVDGLTLNGIGAMISASNSGITWNNASYGAGFYAEGNGVINLGTHVAINKFYYSGLADYGGRILAPKGGVSGSYAGDVNFLARHNGSIDCEGCAASYAADTSWSGATLGCNWMAEDGGELNVTGSSGQYSLVGAVCARTGGHAWASNFHGLGGLGGKVGAGLDARENGVISGGASTYAGYQTGAWVQLGAYANLDSAVFTGNGGDGVFVSGHAYVEGNVVTVSNNGGFGFHVVGQSAATLYNSLAVDTGNADGVAFVEDGGTSNGFAFSGSSLFIQ